MKFIEIPQHSSDGKHHYALMRIESILYVGISRNMVSVVQDGVKDISVFQFETEEEAAEVYHKLSKAVE